MNSKRVGEVSIISVQSGYPGDVQVSGIIRVSDLSLKMGFGRWGYYSVFNYKTCIFYEVVVNHKGATIENSPLIPSHRQEASYSAKLQELNHING